MKSEEAQLCEEDCLMCNGEACDLCGAGCRNNNVQNCEHDVIDRHNESE